VFWTVTGALVAVVLLVVALVEHRERARGRPPADGSAVQRRMGAEVERLRNRRQPPGWGG
jgi:hypothetical protein